MEYTAKECEKLEGKEIKVVLEDGVYAGIVIGCDPDIGITIIDKDDKGFNFICLNGPMSGQHEHHKAYYEPVFNALVKFIIEGAFISADLGVTARQADSSYREGQSKIAECAFL